MIDQASPNVNGKNQRAMSVCYAVPWRVDWAVSSGHTILLTSIFHCLPKCALTFMNGDINSYLSPRMNLFVLKINRFNNSLSLTEHLFGTVFAIRYRATAAAAALLLFWTFVSEPRTTTWLVKRFILFSLSLALSPPLKRSARSDAVVLIVCVIKYRFLWRCKHFTEWVSHWWMT